MTRDTSSYRNVFYVCPATGCSSLDEWYEKCGTQVRTMRRFCLLASCWVYRRHQCQWGEFPWLLAGLADRRRPLSERRRIASDFLRAAPCCLRAGMARRLRLRDPPLTVDQMVSPEWVEVWHYFALLVTMQIADIERRHGRNRKQNNKNGQSCLAQFVAKYIGGEASELHRAQVARAKVLQARRALPAELPPAAVAPQLLATMDYVRTPTGFSLWRAESIRRDRELGTLKNPITKEDWAFRKAEWAAKPAADKEAYDQEAQAVAPRAQVNRKRRRVTQAEAVVSEGGVQLLSEEHTVRNICPRQVSSFVRSNIIKASSRPGHRRRLLPTTASMSSLRLETKVRVSN